MKTKDELNHLKQEMKTLNNKLTELNDDELGYVIGGTANLVLTARFCEKDKCELNPDTCNIKKQTGFCPKEYSE